MLLTCTISKASLILFVVVCIPLSTFGLIFTVLNKVNSEFSLIFYFVMYHPIFKPGVPTHFPNHIGVNGLNPRIWHLEQSQFRQLSIPSAFQTASKSKKSKLKSAHKSHNFNFCVAWFSYFWKKSVFYYITMSTLLHFLPSWHHMGAVGHKLSIPTWNKLP